MEPLGALIVIESEANGVMNTQATRLVVGMLLTVALGAAWSEAGGRDCDEKTAPRAEANVTVNAPGNVPKEAHAGQSVWMRVKMKRADGILEGLAQGDFNAIKVNAQTMQRFGRMERWARVKSEEYQTHLRAFDQANRDLIRQADEQNLEGATLAFFQLTTSCVQCHQVVRDNEALLPEKVSQLTHVVTHATEYYVGGPQQARPADGTLEAGTLVSLEQQAGSYAKVLTEEGVRAFVATDALKEIDVEAAK